MITTVLFDVGQVLLTFDPEPYYQTRMAPERWKKTMDLLFHTKYWQHYDQGLYSEAELIDAFLKEAPELKEEIDLVFSTYMELLQPIEEMAAFALELKKNFRISILSNMPEKSEPYILKHYPFLREFELPMYSWRWHRIKPDPEIFKIQLQRLQVLPEEVLFVDDRPINLAAAEALGMAVQQMTTAEETISQIRKKLNLDCTQD